MCCSERPRYGTLSAMTASTDKIPNETRHHNFIDGSWVSSVSGELFENRNPANTRDRIGLFQRSTREDVDLAIAAARRAYERWRLVPAPRRAEILFRAAQLLAE